MPTWKQLKNNPELLDVFRLRQNTIAVIREFFDREGFTELFTPILQPAVIPESYTDIFSTEIVDRSLNKKPGFLIPSPEVTVKKLIAAGIGSCYEITHCFRNRESGSRIHNYEFQSLEWYRIGAGYLDILEDTQNLLLKVVEKINGGLTINYQNNPIDFRLPWEKISVSEAIRKYAGMTLGDISDSKNRKNPFPAEKIAGVARRKGYTVNRNNTWEEIFNQIFLNEVEPHLGSGSRPTIIYDYPAPMAALGKISGSDPLIVERFEIYAGKIELADCVTELTDYPQQKARFKSHLTEIKRTSKNPVRPDNDFLDALKKGLPSCAGIAMGIDRLIMLLSDKKDIRDVVFSLEF